MARTLAQSNNTITKKVRQQQLVELLKTGSFYQNELQDKLISILGIDISQPTISRDLKELNINKHKGKYSLPSHYMKEQNKKELAEILVKYHAKPCDNTVSFFALKTTPGTSHLLAQHLEQVYSEEIIGSIPGSEFCLFITKDANSAMLVLNQVNESIKP